MHPGIIVAGVGFGVVGLAGLAAAGIVGVSAMGNSNNARGTCPFDAQAVSNVTTVGSGGSSAGAGSDNPLLFQTIISMSHGNNRAIATGMLGSNLESGWNDNVVNSIGATGDWQILLSVHPEITSAEAKDPVVSTHFWFPHYLEALSSVGDNEWATDPERAAEEVAVIAEVPGPSYYQLEGVDVVHAKWQQTLAAMKRYGVSTDFGSEQAGTIPGTSQVSLVNAVLDNPTGSSGECTDGVYDANGIPDTTGNGGGSQNTEVGLIIGVPAAQQRQTVVTAAMKWLGTPYSFGGGNAQGPTTGVCTNDAGWNDCHIVGFDCSGLTLYAYAKIGLQLAHYVATDWSNMRGFTVVGRGQPLTNALPGDMIVFTGGDGSFDQPGHVGIYLGNGKMIDAPQSGEVIRIDDVTTPFWQSEFVGVVDPFAYLAATRQTA
jgi:cell wall-associated NlpC family hydrolase